MTKVITFDTASPTPSNGYRLRYRIQNFGSTYITVTGYSPMTLDNLEDGVIYEYLLDSNCSGGNFSNTVSGTFNTYNKISGHIYLTGQSGPGHPTTLHLEFNHPLAHQLQFKWGFCWTNDACELNNYGYPDWPIITVPQGTSTFTVQSQTAGWNTSTSSPNKIYLWDITSGVIINLTTDPYNQTLYLI